MRNVAILVMTLGFLACETPTQVQEADTTPLLSVVGGPGPVVGSASGSGHALCDEGAVTCYSLPGDDQLRTFSFTAQLHEDGTVRGQAQFNNRGQSLSWDADVECMLFRPSKPNQVWMMGTLTRGYGGGDAVPLPYEEGARVIFAVEDNGQGSQGTPDRIIGVGVAPEIQYQLFCPLFNQQIEPPAPWDFFFEFLTFSPIRGNLQVRSP